VNKGFEVIEARWLYDTDFSKIDVIIHKESIIHSMVEYEDSSVIAQMSYPTMELPISLALSCPERLDNQIKSLDFFKLGKLTFDKPDSDRFPCLDLIISAGKQGGLYPAVANGANEQAVKYYLENRIGYTDIFEGIKGALDAFKGNNYSTFEELECANNFGVDFIKNKFGV
jgi:1-deoxy-D-xylulose-5-phosphate reductoisomerase